MAQEQHSPQPVESTTTAPTPASSPPARVVRHTPTPVQTAPVLQRQIQPQRVVKKVDPVEQWLLAANMGSYGATNVNVQSQTVVQRRGSNGYPSGPSNERANHLGLNERQRANSHQRGERGYSTVNVSYSEQVNATGVKSNLEKGDLLRMGTQVEGEIETDIVWMRGANNQQRNYLIRLKEGLKGEQGQEIVPKGSLVVAKIQEFYGSTGMIQLGVQSIMSGTKEYQIPAHSLMVLDRKGRILQAKAERASQVQGEAAAFLLSGIGRAAAVLNNPSQTSYSTFGSSTIYGDGDALSGFIEGATNSAVDSLEQRQALARSRAQGSPTVYVIKAGTKVQLLVNQSFNLSK